MKSLRSLHFSSRQYHQICLLALWDINSCAIINDDETMSGFDINSLLLAEPVGLQCKFNRMQYGRRNLRAKKESNMTKMCCALCCKPCNMDESYTIQGAWGNSAKISLIYACRKCIVDFNVLNFDSGETSVMFAADIRGVQEYFVIDSVFKTDE